MIHDIVRSLEPKKRINDVLCTSRHEDLFRNSGMLLIPIEPGQQIKDQRHQPEEWDADQEKKRQFHEICFRSVCMRS